jgi:thiol-disulfide isomerase/thioredoxin
MFCRRTGFLKVKKEGNAKGLRFSSLLKYFLVLTTIFVSSNAYSFKPGDEAPDFTGTNFFAKDEVINFTKDLKGKKVVLLEFWSIFCVSCKEEMPKLVEIYEKYKNEDIYFISVDLDTSSRRVRRYFQNPANVTPPYFNVMDKRRIIANLFKVSILPTTIIIGKDGKITKYHVGYKPGDEKDMEETIKSLLSVQAAKP